MDSEARMFLRAVQRHWITLMVGGVSIIVTAVGAVGGQAALLWSFGLIGFGCIVAAFYLAWRDEHRALVAASWRAALEENEERRRDMREFVRIWPEERKESSGATVAGVGGKVHLFSENWMTQTQYPEAEGRKMRLRCMRFQLQLEKLQPSDAPFAKPDVAGLTPDQMCERLEDNRAFLQVGIDGILRGDG
jgi:hypothetical protein